MDIKEQINRLAGRGEPFLVLVDFELQKPRLYPFDQLEKHSIAYALNASSRKLSANMEKFPIPFDSYKKKFDHVIENIKSGNVYLLNLCLETPIQIDLDLEAIYTHSEALFKLYKKDDFVCFTPERFITLQDCTISTFPMKGTLSANIPDAKAKLLDNPKELAEHIMIVDLLRNDLGMVAKAVEVEDFRYIERIATSDGPIYQTSSKISATLPKNWRENLGDILFRLLPAGSISGTPKRSATHIIQHTEGFTRGYFTGVAGVYDGENFDSFVLIRFIEQQENGLVFKSGGGITIDSNADLEYQEILNKVYFSF